jgi:S1-C subfamily serine protease
MIGSSASAVAGDEVTETYKRVRDSVVVLRTVQKEVVEQGPRKKVVGVRGLGSGVLVKVPGKNGEEVRVLTAAHVVQAADFVHVELPGGKVTTGKVVSSVPQADVALLRLDRVPEGLTTVPMADSDSAQVGDRVMVVGAPYGLSHTLTVGHVSARRKQQQVVGVFEELELIQTDAAINQGNSGGPLFNMKGEVLGIVSHILSQSGGFEGMGFAVTSNLTKRLLLDEAAPWSGIDGLLVGGDLGAALNVPQAAGILVQRVALGSMASKMGIRPGTLPAVIEGRSVLLGGDVILAVAGTTLEPDRTSWSTIRGHLRKLEPGAAVEVTVLRAGKKVNLKGRKPVR